MQKCEEKCAAKKFRYIEQQIAFALNESGLGTLVEKVRRKIRISDAAFTFSAKVRRLGALQIVTLGPLEEVNRPGEEAPTFERMGL
ncbi:hypothetical protein JJB74_31005 [Noviherbaspirillum sp. DKR-6]|uniref:Uncharacterized protein n=1 Tax=Noviherbaspirillum pedocola TaxID=2801341 RepID=A0A934T0E1_9BURK|nr:hypothetical protein [Noviherbaspirillum pedocola]